jgi:hypothetical protein
MAGLLQNGAFQNQSKVTNDKQWQMTATYVEVCGRKLYDQTTPEAD